MRQTPPARGVDDDGTIGLARDKVLLLDVPDRREITPAGPERVAARAAGDRSRDGGRDDGSTPKHRFGSLVVIVPLSLTLPAGSKKQEDHLFRDAGWLVLPFDLHRDSRPETVTMTRRIQGDDFDASA